MKAKLIVTIFCLTFSFLGGIAQHRALTITDADKENLSISHLDEVYLSAVHVDTSKAVFKSEAEQQQMFEAYKKLLQDFGRFLKSNNFVWDQQTTGFNRIYFDSDGSIDYFLYNFQPVKPEDQLSKEKQAEFNRLLNLFIQDYKIPMKANRKFAQCSPTTYQPSQKKMY